jgi:3-dehydroquinate synthase
VICDCTAFAASIYMRGTALALVPTTLLCMVDASLGGKTGFDLEGIKNLAGTFYPAGMILIAAEALKTLPRREWKSGMAEVIKTAILDRNPVFFEALGKTAVFPGQPDMGELRDWISGTTESPPADHFYKQILPFIEQAVLVKGRIVAEDPREDSSFPQEQPDTPGGRALLNLGHTFGHALESALGLGTISHGEAVAWGMARSCELGKKLGITPPDRAAAILQTLKAWGFTTAVSGFSVAGKTDAALGRKFQDALFSDKKKQGGKLRFVVPRTEGAVLVQQNDQVTAYLDSLYAEL